MQHALLAPGIWVCFIQVAQAHNSAHRQAVLHTVHCEAPAAPYLHPQPEEKAVQQQAPEKRRARFGIKLGGNLSAMNFNQVSPKPSPPFKTIWAPGFTGGFTLQVPLFGKLSLQQDYLISQRAGEDKDAGLKYRLQYLSLPVMLEYAISPRVVLMVGPQFDLLIKAKQQAANGTFNVTHDTEERNVGASAGIELSLSNHLSLDLRYMAGLNHIGLGQRSTVREFKYQLAQATVSLKL
ncbi:porin family protein [Hymenobacter jejuensis]|uniref:PorT family protein n=1 Tax=Hymenobacter jejuensis TaxID=2502781 RepID=A0A5B7ZXD5_9BACT|nr:porin family protein [Hymenobacter jejuensis]QDA59537.1 PorT family protein [Hymenobacter jejuensis]